MRSVPCAFAKASWYDFRFRSGTYNRDHVSICSCHKIHSFLINYRMPTCFYHYNMQKRKRINQMDHTGNMLANKHAPAEQFIGVVTSSYTQCAMARDSLGGGGM